MELPEQQNTNQTLVTPPPRASNGRKWVIALIAVLLIAGAFRIGYNAGQSGYSFSVKEFKVINKNGQPTEVDYSLLWKALDIVNKKYIDKDNIDQQKVLYGAISGAVSAAGDDYTEFFDPETLAQFKTELQGTFGGIGAEVGKRSEGIIVIAPLDDTPASKAGLLPKDAIISIDGQSTAGMTVDEAVGKIRGEVGTQVTLTLYRAGRSAPFDVTITRQKIEVKSVKIQYKEINGNQVAILKITRFGDDTKERFDAAVKEIRSKNINKLILDVRNNPGGYLETSVQLASAWLPKGTLVVTEAHSEKDTLAFNSLGGNQFGSTKTIVLINGGSASASEILAGALKDNGKASLIGEKSFGKGSVQELVPLGNNAAVKVTIAKWITPSGKHLNKDGLEPDIKVELTEEDVLADRDPQLDRALQEIVK